MKFRNLHRWGNPLQQESLIFFVQLLEEMLFDFSLDTYKPSAMNSSLLCIEAIKTIDEIEKGIIQRPNIDHIIEELVENIINDPVAKSLITLNLQKAFSIIKNKHTPLVEIKTILELFWSEINLSRYKERNEQLLIEAIIHNREKTLITTLTRSYVTALKNHGYHAKYLYDSTLSFFYYTNQINSESLNEYISLFNTESKAYIAIYRASNIFEEISDSCQMFGIDVTKDAGEFQDIITRLNHSIGKDEVYVIVKEIDAREYYSARHKSDQMIESISTLLTLFHHKKHPTWSKDCIVLDIQSNHPRKISKPINPMHKCIDLKPNKASKKLNQLINNLSLDHKSLPKFFRSAQLHSQALESDSYENQLINLWVALESLVPPKGEKGDRSKIETIVESVLPFLNLTYVDRLINRFISDVFNWKQRELRKSLKDIPGPTLESKFMKLLILSEFENERNAFIASFHDFHLLNERFHHLSKIFNSPKEIQKLLDRHAKRIQWQIRRIYRARNLIVHKGTPPTYTSILIENIHDYLDIVMNTLVRLSSDNLKLDSIEQGFKYVELNYSAYYEGLEKNKDPFTIDNIDDLLFKYLI